MYAIRSYYGFNFGAGMTGGVAYIYDESDNLDKKINKQSVKIEPFTSDEEEELKQIIEERNNFV